MTAHDKQHNGFDTLAVHGHQHPSAPYLSVVATSRNDNHGNDLSRRTQIFIDSLVEQANRHRLPTELILVEWNPPHDRPPLVEELRWPIVNKWCSIRIVTVPSEIHLRFPYAKILPMFQMIAKNVGVRRATGQFVLQTNIDIVFSNQLFQWIARRNLRLGVLYRCDRVDVDRNLPTAATLEDALEYCRTHVLRVSKLDGMWIVPPGTIPATVKDAQHVPVLTATFGSGLSALPLAVRIADSGRRVLRKAEKKQAILLLHGKIALAWLVGIAYELLLVCGFAVLASVRMTSVLMQLTASAARRIATSLGLNRIEAWMGQSRLYRLLRYRLPEARAALRSCGYKPSITLIVDYLLASTRKTPPLHTYACGDFILTDRRSWEQMRGTPELPVFSMNLDSLALITAYKAGITVRNLPSDHVIYHIDHGDGWTPNQQFELYKRINTRGVPIISYWTYLRHAENILQDRNHFLSDVNWGLSEVTLPERIVSRRLTAPVPSICIRQEWMESATSTNMLLNELGASASPVTPHEPSSPSVGSEAVKIRSGSSL
jgi:hypothetical protein